MAVGLKYGKFPLQNKACFVFWGLKKNIYVCVCNTHIAWELSAIFGVTQPPLAKCVLRLSVCWRLLAVAL